MFLALPTALRLLIAPLLSVLKYQDTYSAAQVPQQLAFSLRHQHAVANDSRILFADAPPSFLTTEYILSTKYIRTHRPRSSEAFNKARMNAFLNSQTDADLWTMSDTSAPNVDNRETLLELAKMTSNAYYEHEGKGWYDLGSYWGNKSYPFGWEPDADGFRGHIYVSEDNSTVVLSIKGTSLLWLIGDGGPTVKKDRLNDNLLFSCCCARVGPTWSTVCDCHSGGYKCDTSCLSTALMEESLFYNVAVNLYNNVTYMYPDANIWLIGHSLGGSLASLLGATFGAPVVGFEAPGEKLASSRLHLPSPPSMHHITHVYHTADPIAMGVCNGVGSPCALGGYALETGCHLGKAIKYDTVTKLNWAVDARKHSIQRVIDEVLSEDWDPTNEDVSRRQVPLPEEEQDCIDCFDWQFGDFKKSKSM